MTLTNAHDQLEGWPWEESFEVVDEQTLFWQLVPFFTETYELAMEMTRRWEARQDVPLG